MKNPNEANGFRLLIVTTSASARDELLALFKAVKDVEVRALDSGEAVHIARFFLPDVVLIDLALLGDYAFLVARNFRVLYGKVRLLFLDDAVCSAHICTALRMGAFGYWTTTSSLAELSKAVRQIAAGEYAFCPAARRYLTWTTSGPQFRLPPDIAATARLTRRQSEVLALLAKNLSVKQCAEQMQLAPSTVQRHKSELMKKLNLPKTAD